MCGKSNQMSGNDKSKINCQCDGNCDCGTILPNGDISCDNCGWKAPEAYNALTGNNVCPSCRTESSYSSNSNNVKPNKNQTMNNNQANIPQGVVAAGAGLDGLLLWEAKPFGGEGPVMESNFANNVSSKNIIGYGAGQDWAVLNPFQSGRASESRYLPGYEQLSDEDKKWADAFEMKTADLGEESGLFEGIAMATRAVFCQKVCKGLGYMRSDDKTAFKKCKSSCQLKPNFTAAKQGKWNYPPAPEMTAEDFSSPAQNAADAAKEAAILASQNVPPADVYAGDYGMKDAAPAKNNTLLYVIIGVVVLAIIIGVILMMRRRPAA